MRHWIAQGVKIFRVDNPHTKPLQFWEWLLARGQRRAPRGRVPRRGVHPPGDDAVARAGRDSSRATPTSPGATPRSELEEFFTEISHETADFLRPNLFVNTPDILTEYLQFGGAAGLQDPRGARGDGGAAVGRLRRLRAVRERRAAGQPKRTSTTRSTSTSSATGRTAEAARRLARAVPDAAQRASARAHPALAAAAQPARALERRRRDPRLHQAPRRRGSPAGQRRRDHRRRQRRPALGARDDRAPRPRRARPRARRQLRRRAT